MSLGGKIRTGLNRAIDALTPDNQVEYLKFTRISGAYFKDYIATKAALTSPPSEADLSSVKLKVNPQSISYKQQKIITKIQTSSPNRFTVFDWGNDLLQITISGCTGNLLPSEITSGYNPMKGVMNDLSLLDDMSSVSQDINSIVGEIAPFTQNVMIGSMSYYELLGMSPKYKTFMKLQAIYRNSDADRDIITLETGETIYRGYFVDFSFDQTAESPWNWKYTITFSALIDLASFFSRSDQAYTSKLLLEG